MSIPRGATFSRSWRRGARATLDIPSLAHGFPAQRDAGRGDVWRVCISRCQNICVSVGMNQKEATGPRGRVLKPVLAEDSLGSLDRLVSRTLVQRF